MTRFDRLRGDRGQTSAEWMGILLVVGAIVAALVTSGFGRDIAVRTEAIVCWIAGGECKVPDSSEPTADTCTLTQSARSAQGSVKVAVFRLEGGVRGVREERADGSVRITLEANGGAGLEFSTPSADVDADGEGEGVGTGDRELRVVGGGRASRSWVFGGGTPEENRRAADDFTEDVEDKVKAKLDIFPWTDGPDLPDHTDTTISGGVEVSGKGETGAGRGLEGNLGIARGATFDDRTGEKTVFYEVKAGGKVGASSAFFDGLSASGRGTVRMAVTYFPDGREKSMQVLGTGEGTLDASFDPTGGKLDDTMDALSKSVDGSVGGRVVLNAKLDLTKPENLRAARAFMDGRDPDTGEAVSGFDGARDLYGRFRDDGRVSVQTYRVATNAYGAGFDATAVGADFNYESSDADLIRAWYHDPQEGFKPWDRCNDRS